MPTDIVTRFLLLVLVISSSVAYQALLDDITNVVAAALRRLPVDSFTGNT